MQPFWQEFFTSPGFGGVAAVLAAMIAYIGIRFRAKQDKQIAAGKVESDAAAAVEEDSLQRWWDVAMWLWENYPKLSVNARLAVLDALEDSMVHKAHGGILVALTEAVLAPVEQEEEASGS